MVCPETFYFYTKKCNLDIALSHIAIFYILTVQPYKILYIESHSHIPPSLKGFKGRSDQFDWPYGSHHDAGTWPNTWLNNVLLCKLDPVP